MSKAAARTNVPGAFLEGLFYRKNILNFHSKLCPLRYCSPSCQEASRTLHQTECRLLKEERQEKERKEVEAVGDWTFSHVMTFEQYWQKMDTKVHKLSRNIGDSPDDLLKISFDMTHSLKNNKFM